MSGFDITEGRPTQAIAVDLGILTGNIWQNTGIDYDVAIGGMPFLLDATEEHPYERSTAPFRKNQFDTQRDPGEQSLTGWWIRSQSSFHAGEGVEFYDPFANPFSTTLASNSYRFNTSLGVNPWDFGNVSLLNRPSLVTNTTSALHIESAHIGTTDYVLMLDGDIKLVNAAGSSTTLVTHSSTIYSMCSDGTYVYYIDAGNVWKKPLDNSTSAVALYNLPSGLTITSASMHWVKQRLVAGINNSLYELTGSGGASLPTPAYTHPNTKWKWVDIAEAGPAIYAGGYAGVNSAVYMFVLSTAGIMPILTSGIIGAELPDGEVLYSMYSHLGTYIAFGTNKGVRVATVDQSTGDLTYGQLLANTLTPVRGFCARDSYIWFGAAVYDGVDYYAGTWRIDLTSDISNLEFSVAQDVYADEITTQDTATYDVCHLGNTDQIAFLASTNADTPSSLGLWLQSATEVYPSGWIQTGYIRYNTLELKNYKRVVGRGDFGTPITTANPMGASKGSMTISTVDLQGNQYDMVSYDYVVGTPEVYITNPVGGQDAIAVKFTLYRDANDITLSPVFKGYQLKAVPATPRVRIIKIPLLCYDNETDKYNVSTGYTGKGYDKLAALEAMEAAGDVLTLQDFRTGETNQCLIEELTFINKTSPDKRLTNFEGTVILTVRTV